MSDHVRWQRSCCSRDQGAAGYTGGRYCDDALFRSDLPKAPHPQQSAARLPRSRSRSRSRGRAYEIDVHWREQMGGPSDRRRTGGGGVGRGGGGRANSLPRSQDAHHHRPPARSEAYCDDHTGRAVADGSARFRDPRQIPPQEFRGCGGGCGGGWHGGEKPARRWGARLRFGASTRNRYEGVISELLRTMMRASD